MRHLDARSRCLHCPVKAGLCDVVIPDKVIYRERKIKPSHQATLTGQVPMLYWRAMVPYESGLERDSLLWLRECRAITDIAAQSVCVTGWIEGRYTYYTPDLILTFGSGVSPPLEWMGFGTQTIVEVKPQEFANDPLVQRKLCLARKSLRVPAVIVTELHLQVPITEEIDIHVH